MERISLAEARKIALLSQGLADKPTFGSGAEGALNALEHLGYVQIDTISVVERAHHHIFWSRVRDYRPEHLHQLVAERKAFEYWAHAASYLPMRDFRFSLPRKKRFSSGEYHWFTPTDEYRTWRRRILQQIRADGALPTRAFEGPRPAGKGGWFQRKPAKLALEQLFMEGKLMVAGRQGFEKVYDLTERVLPDSVDTRFPKPAEYARHLIETGLRSHGFVRPDEVAYLRKGPMKELVRAEFVRMEKEGRVGRVMVEGIAEPYYMDRQRWNELREQAALFVGATRVLSPFDGQVIQRRRLQELFGFDYLIECYTPEAKRRFGYFCLPLLEGERFVGRVDAKAVRAEGLLRVKAFHVEKPLRKPEVWERVQGELRDFGRFNGCERLKR